MGSRYRGRAEEVRALSAFINLMRAADALSGSLHGELAAKGLTTSQFGALEALHHLGPMRAGDLAGKLLRSGGSVTVLVAGLEKRGLARRERPEADQRVVRVALTAKGKALIAGLFPAHARAVTRRMAALTPAQQDELRRLCRIVGTAARG